MALSIQIIDVPEGETIPKREYFSLEAPLVVGREFSCDLVLPSADSSISRFHARIDKTTGGSYTVTDTSTNGSYLNDVALKNRDMYPYRDGDVLSIGGYRLIVSISDAGLGDITSKQGKDSINSGRHFGKEFWDTQADRKSGDGLQNIVEKSSDFRKGMEHLEKQLLFDPFENGPELKEEGINLGAKPSECGGNPAIAAKGDSVEASPSMGLFYQGQQRAAERAHNLRAITNSIDRFLEIIDPNSLEEEYREFLGILALKNARYWKIHKKQFEKRRQNGDLRRAFLSLLAEEMGKR